MERYAELRTFIINAAKNRVDEKALVQLKHDYAGIINSVRTSEYINDFTYLIEILERRGALRYNNIELFRDIVKKYLNDSHIHHKLDEYESWFQNYSWPYPEHTNLYALNEFSNGECFLQHRNINHECFPSKCNHIIHPGTRINSNILNLNICKLCHELSRIQSNDTITKSTPNIEQNVQISLENNIRDSLSIVDDRTNMVSTIFAKGQLCCQLQLKTNANEISHDDTIMTRSTTNNLNGCTDTADTPLILSPESISPQSLCSEINEKSSRNLVVQSKSLETIFNQKIRCMNYIKKRNTSIILLIFIVGLSSAIIFFLINFLNTTVYIKPQPSAPSLEKIYQRYSDNSRTLYTGYNGPNGLQNQQSTQETYQNYSSNTNPSIHKPIPRDPPIPPLQRLKEPEQRIQQFVFERVSTRLGSSWRDVARCLGVREYSIDDIESQHNLSLKEKAYAALKIFASESDVNYWAKNLKSALEKARRRDLREDVEEFLSRKF